MAYYARYDAEAVARSLDTKAKALPFRRRSFQSIFSIASLSEKTCKLSPFEESHSRRHSPPKYPIIRVICHFVVCSYPEWLQLPQPCIIMSVPAPYAPAQYLKGEHYSVTFSSARTSFVLYFSAFFQERYHIGFSSISLVLSCSDIGEFSIDLVDRFVAPARSSLRSGRKLSASSRCKDPPSCPRIRRSTSGPRESLTS